MLSGELATVYENALPDIITRSRVVEANLEIDKVFPKLGLPNCQEKVSITAESKDLDKLKFVSLAVNKYLAEVKANCNLNKFSASQLYKVSRIKFIFEELSRRIKSHNSYFTEHDNKIVLKQSILSEENQILVRAGKNLVKLVQDLLHAGKRYGAVDLINPEDVVSQLKNTKIIFSSDGKEGAWDIATMSMRGVKSCMRWQHEQATRLLGSIIDPCCGIIYLTNRKRTPFGSKMLFRAVVRLVIRDNKTHLLLDRLYSSFYKIDRFNLNKLDKSVKKLFINFLSARSKCSVLDSDLFIGERLVIPSTKVLNFLNETEVSYMDSGTVYSCESYDDLEIYLKGVSQTNDKKPLLKKVA